MYTTSGLRNQKAKNEDDETEEPQMDVENEDIEEKNNCMDYIIAGPICSKKLPKYVLLQDPMPREPKLMRKRAKPAVLRYHKESKDQQYENWMFKELMLYTPFRKADLDDYDTKTAEIYKEKQDWIKSVKEKVMRKKLG